MEMTMNRPMFPVFGIGLFLVIIVLALTGTVVLGSHATERHQEHASSGRECSDNPNSVQFFNPTTNRFALVCLTSEGKWGAFIYEKVDGTIREVTSFVKDKMKTFEQVEKYFKNAGYDYLH